MPITKTIRKRVNGETITETRTLTAREIKAETMKNRGWDKTTYQKQYDLFKNKLRAFENFQRAHGVSVKSQSPAEMLYKQAKAMAREGKDYKPTIAMQRIMSFSAVSITKGRELAQDFDSVYTKHRMATFAKTTSTAFEALIKANPKAREIVEKVIDPVKREKALAEFANYMHVEMSAEGEAIADGEVYGSDEAGSSFDYSYWL